MSFICKNGRPHTHASVQEARECWGFASSPALPTVAATPPVPPTVSAPAITVPQLNYIEVLHGDLAYARTLSKTEASKYIDRLKKDKERRGRMEAATKAPLDPRLPLIEGMLDMIPDGYFATQAEEGAKINFLRINRPTRGKMKDSLKLQTQHGPRWENAVVLWPSGNWSIYNRTALDYMMLVIADPTGCGRRYGKLGHCCRCNCELTDERSRHYGIGPECEKHWPSMIAQVDDINGGMSYEQLSAAGMLEG